MATDAIESALKKGDAKFEQLQAKTMPFYDKMQQGKFSKSDLKKLKQLYQEQSKVAAKTFEESSKAVEKNARAAARSIVSKSVSNKELLNAKELSVILNSAFSKAFQKSADQVKQAVDEAIQGQLEDIKATLDLIQQQMLSEQEVISHIRELMLPSFSALAQIENPDFETLLDPRVRRRFLKKREKSLADEIVTRTVKAIIGYDKLKEEQRTGQFKKRKTSWYNPFSYVTGTVSQLKDLYRRQKFERQFGKLDTVEELGDVYNAMSKKKSKLGQFFESASAAKQFAQSVLFNLSQYNFGEGKIRHGIRPGMGASFAFDAGFGSIPARNVSTLSSPIARLVSYTTDAANRKKRDRIERFSVESTRQRMREFLQMDEWSQTKSNLQNMLGYYLNPFKSISAKIYKIAREQYIDRLRAKARTDKEQARVQEFIKNTRSIEQNREASRFAARKFEKLREIILSDVKKQWVFNIKNTAAQYYKKVKDRVTKSKAFDKTKSFLKTLGLVYIGAQIINFLQSTMPGWREKVISAIGTGLSEGFKFLANFFLDSLGTILKGTALFMRDNADLIASIILKVVGHVVKAIVDAVFALLFGEKVNSINEETDQQQRTAINTWTKTDQYKQLVDEAAPYFSSRYEAAAAIQNYMSNRGSTQGLAEGFNDVTTDSATSVLPQELIDKLSKIKTQNQWSSTESELNKRFAKDKLKPEDEEDAKGENLTDKNVSANSIITSSQKGSASDVATVTSVDVKSPQEKYNEKKQRDQILGPVTQNPASLSTGNESVPQTAGSSNNSSGSSMPSIPNKVTSPDLSLLNGGLLLGDA